MLIQALMPSAEDRLDPVLSDQLSGSDVSGGVDDDVPVLLLHRVTSLPTDQLLSQDTLYENPFLKPARQLKLKS